MDELIQLRLQSALRERALVATLGLLPFDVIENASAVFTESVDEVLAEFRDWPLLNAVASTQIALVRLAFQDAAKEAKHRPRTPLSRHFHPNNSG